MADVQKKKSAKQAEKSAEKATQIKKSASRKVSNDAAYVPNGVDFGLQADKEAAYAELEAYRAIQTKFDRSLFDYKTWAKENVHYSNLTKPQIQQKLRSCNDSYTIAMLSDMMSSFRNGIDITTLVQFCVTTKIVKTMNPSFDMDVSRLMSNLRANVVDAINSDPNKANGPLGDIANVLEKKFMDESATRFGSEVTRNMAQHTLDSMIMTPRQVAALKLNFMEQCYVDMRSVGTDAEVDQKYSEYQHAVKHLDAIANNSGFDMSVVAAEERYLVGLRIRENPEYANVFGETYDLSTRMKFDNNTVWSGHFVTMDGEDYTVGRNSDYDSVESRKIGAFSPRKPYGCGMDVDPKASLKVALERRAELFAEAVKYMASEDCEFDASPSVRKSILNRFEANIDDYREKTIAMLQDDGIVSSKSAGRKFFKECFEDKFEEVKSQKTPTVVSQAFLKEMKHSANRDVLTAANVDTSYFSMNNKSVSAADTESHLRDVQQLIKNYADNEKYKAARFRYERAGDNKLKPFFEGTTEAEQRSTFADVRTGKEIIDDMRKNTMSSLDIQSGCDFLTRVVYNIEQGYLSRGAWERPNSLDNEKDFAVSKSQVKLSKDREIPDISISAENQDDNNYSLV